MNLFTALAQSSISIIISLLMGPMLLSSYPEIRFSKPAPQEYDLNFGDAQIELASDWTIADNIDKITSNTKSTVEPIAIIIKPKKPDPSKILAMAFIPQSRPMAPISQHDSMFNQYAGQFNLDPSTLKMIAYCESHYNPGVTSRNGLYGGMYQFSASTWESTRNAMGLDPNPELRYDAEQSIMTAAFKISHGGIGAWPVCSTR